MLLKGFRGKRSRIRYCLNKDCRDSCRNFLLLCLKRKKCSKERGMNNNHTKGNKKKSRAENQTSVWPLGCSTRLFVVECLEIIGIISEEAVIWPISITTGKPVCRFWMWSEGRSWLSLNHTTNSLLAALNEQWWKVEIRDLHLPPHRSYTSSALSRDLPCQFTSTTPGRPCEGRRGVQKWHKGRQKAAF